MKTFRFVALAVLALAGCTASSIGVSVPTDAAGSASDIESAPAPPLLGRVGAHGMVVVGSPEDAFLSHIPMFGAPHDVQLVVAGTFELADGGPLPALVSFSDRPITFLPDRSSLDALRTGALRELIGTLFLGNFEAGGRPLLTSRVRFTVSRVVHQHVLDQRSTETELGYVLFGTRARTFAVHRIARMPSFDEVLTVKVGAGDAPTDGELEIGVEVVEAARADDEAGRLGIATAPRTLSGGSRSFAVQPLTVLSCLLGPDFTGSCPDPATTDR